MYTLNDIKKLIKDLIKLKKEWEWIKLDYKHELHKLNGRLKKEIKEDYEANKWIFKAKFKKLINKYNLLD